MILELENLAKPDIIRIAESVFRSNGSFVHKPYVRWAEALG
jgi:hypothetical protein